MLHRFALSLLVFLFVVVGKNGHGKSNLLDAIQFVLSDKYSNLRTDEKIKLIYVSAVEHGYCNREKNNNLKCMFLSLVLRLTNPSLIT
jgi:AAA15 family ATPase/GTPase